ncbi:MAG: hypothetical protein OEW78_00820 [Nitrosopumilus sp.]|uniref:hypothetical protein n=1 Tax=Nitrosopumilus sp. TaxID=2024843 RepID=UPI002471B634|nr:hypothetical protein [Nitrosopumilus sp.]MDH5430412.1 hypothetical protein [Nitrosopumilus sp.]MDH5666238.1 hypothetical protein [Nitrosopumilus sp.]MDH5697449.1 hypothetical protein [Nitrosopumilus sp.]
MEEESNPIKDYLFEYITKSEIIPNLISEKKFDEIIENVTANCYDKIISMGKKDESVGILATGLLHYLLTNTLITSQRKIEYDGIEIDIVVPDIKTLEKDPKKTLLICIPKSSDPKVINDKILQLEKIQTEKENIWIVLSENIPVGRKSFILSKENNTFSKIVFEIAKFSNVGGSNKFKILRI